MNKKHAIILAATVLATAALAAVTVTPTAPAVAPPLPMTWRATLTHTQTVAVISALATNVCLQGFSLTNAGRATLSAALANSNGQWSTVIYAVAYTNAPAPRP